MDSKQVLVGGAASAYVLLDISRENDHVPEKFKGARSKQIAAKMVGKSPNMLQTELLLGLVFSKFKGAPPGLGMPLLEDMPYQVTHVT